MAYALLDRLYARPPYGPRMLLFACGTSLWRVGSAAERLDHMPVL